MDEQVRKYVSPRRLMPCIRGLPPDLDPALVDDVLIGCVSQVAEQFGLARPERVVGCRISGACAGGDDRHLRPS